MPGAHTHVIACTQVEANNLTLANGHLSRRKEELGLQVEHLQAEGKQASAERVKLSTVGSGVWGWEEGGCMCVSVRVRVSVCVRGWVCM